MAKKAMKVCPAIIKERECVGCKFLDAESFKRGEFVCVQWERATWNRDINGKCTIKYTGRMAFFVMETRTNSKGEYNALIAVEGDHGFFATDWFWGKDFKQAQEIADEKNEQLGLTKREAIEIQTSTMRKGAK